jgi:hypothetical protein
MDNRSTRLMLLGIGILLFSLAFPLRVNMLWLLRFLGLRFLGLDVGNVLLAIASLLGLAFVLVGFFTKDQS